MASNLKELLFGIEKYGDRTAFRFKTGKDNIKDVSYAEFVRETSSLGTVLLEKGLKSGHIAILSENRYEWIVSYLAITASGCTAIPIDRELPDESILYLLKQGDANAVIYSENYGEVIAKADLSVKICMDKPEFYGLINGVKTFAEFEANDGDLAGILFTSGTTGFSKGVMLTHKNIVSNVYAATSYEKFGEHETMLSALPYHHAFECTVGLLASLTFGATICINDSIKYFSKNLALFKPTAMFSVPAIIGAMYKKALEAEKKVGKLIAKVAVKKAFGGKLTRIFSGSAPLDPELIYAFKNYGIRLCQGYGLTETSPVVTMAEYDRLTPGNINTVGLVIPGCEVKIAEGEIWVKGDNVMKGYYKNPEATAETFQDEWFKTGDLGRVDKDGYVYIDGRKKNVIIGSGGENVYPEEIEQYLYNVKYIADALVYGGEDSGTVTAVIYPNYELFEDKKNKKTPEEIEEDIKRTIVAEIDKINMKLPLYKQIRAIKIRKTQFEKTTAKKIKRNKENTNADF